jgi:alkanesulfonate monooxygenase SsuD/methylene tetrahydromethanopterin reductase-like flavin-dependent oxidoreductase (luciferase family)
VAPGQPTPDDYRSGLRAAHRAAEQAGRDPDTISASAYLTVAIADTPPQAAAELTAYLGAYYHLPGEIVAQMIRAAACHAGTLESAAGWMASYAAAGAQHVVVRLARPTLDGYRDITRDVLGAMRSQ